MAPWLWYAVAATLALAALALLAYALFSDRLRNRGPRRRCPKCWYDMTGVAGLRCPECGREQKHEKRLHKRRIRRLPVAAAALLLPVAAVAAAHPYMRDQTYGWWTHAPTWLLIEAAVQTEDHERFVHLSERLRTPKVQEYPVPPDRAFGWSWKRLARGCGDIILDAEADQNTRARAASMMGIVIPDRDAVARALSKLLAEYEDESSLYVSTALYMAVLGGTSLEPDWDPVIVDLAVNVEQERAAQLAVRAIIGYGRTRWDLLPEVLARLPEGKEGEALAASLLNQVLTGSTREIEADVLAFVDNLAQQRAPELTRWQDLVQSLRESVRAHVELRDVQMQYQSRVRAVFPSIFSLLGRDAAEQITLLREQVVTAQALTDGWHSEAIDLLHRIGRIRAEEAIRRGDTIDVTAANVDTTVAQLLKTEDCAVREEVARIVEHYLYVHDGLGDSWIDELLSAACNGSCPLTSAIFAELLARDSTVRAGELRFLLTACAHGYAEDTMWDSVIAGLKLSCAPTVDRIDFADSLLADPDFRAGRHRYEVESLRHHLLELDATAATPVRR